MMFSLGMHLRNVMSKRCSDVFEYSLVCFFFSVYVLDIFHEAVSKLLSFDSDGGKFLDEGIVCILLCIPSLGMVPPHLLASFRVVDMNICVSVCAYACVTACVIYIYITYVSV